MLSHQVVGVSIMLCVPHQVRVVSIMLCVAHQVIVVSIMGCLPHQVIVVVVVPQEVLVGVFLVRIEEGVSLVRTHEHI